MELEESKCLTSGSTTKPQLSRQYGTGTKTEKVGLKLNIQKTKIMASSPITSWQIDGETVETVTDLISEFIFLGSKITADGDCSHEIKRCFGYLRVFLYFHTNCEIICSSSVKNTVGSLIGIALSL